MLGSLGVRIQFPVSLYSLTTLCLNGTLPAVDFMDIIKGDIYPVPPTQLSRVCVELPGMILPYHPLSGP